MSCANPSSSTSSGGSGGNGSGGGGSGCGGGGGPCGACKFLRRKCVAGCVFAAYFDSEQGAAHFAAVHKVFGASNVSKLLLHIPPHRRHDAVVTICYEAQARLRDPVYGCVAHIFALQHQVVNLQTELSYLQAHLATLELPSPPPPPPPPAPTTEDVPPPLSISDLPPASTLPAATYDLSSLFDPTLLMQPAWATPPQRQMDPHPPRHAQYLSSSENLRRATDAPAAAGCGNLQELARELFHRHGSPISPPPAHGPPMSNEPQ